MRNTLLPLEMDRTLIISICILGCLLAASAQNGTDAPETFQEYEKKFKNTVGSVIKKLLPVLLKSSGEADVSGPCSASILKIIGGVRQLKEWAVRFIDATGKIPAGILEGTSLAAGDYDECLDIEVGKKEDKPRNEEDVAFRGQYCLLEAHRPETIQRAIDDFTEGNHDSPIAKTKTFLNMYVRYKHLTNTTFKMGICVPSKCTVDDLESIFNSESLKMVGKISVSFCKHTGEVEERSPEQLFILCILGIILCCLLIGTAFDICFRYNSDDRSENLKSENTSFFRTIVRYTSLYSNSLEVLGTKRKNDSLACLSGIRVFIVVLTIYAHTYAHIHVLHFQKFSKAANFLRFFESFSFSGIANNSVVVDSIVFVAAVTITYNIWRFKSIKEKINLNIFKILILRFIRMSGAQLLMICLFLLTPLIGDGPFWAPYMEETLKNCRKRWWMNLLFINNFFTSTDTCLYHTWLFALILQLTIVGAVLAWILKKSVKWGISLMALLTLSGVIGVGVMNVINNLPGSMAFFMLDMRSFTIVWRDIYQLPYDHVGPFCIGLLMGYYLAIKKDCLKISKLTCAAIWCASIACNSAVMFGLYSYRKGNPINLSVATLYAVAHRNVWALGIGWLVVACTTHHGGAVSRVLKSKIFIPLDRLCCMAYVMHMPIMFFHSGIMRERFFMGHAELLFMGISYTIAAFALSFLLHITFVEPYYALEEHISSLFCTKDELSLELEKDPKQKQIAVIPIHDDPSSNGCVHLAYSKKIDAV